LLLLLAFLIFTTHIHIQIQIHLSHYILLTSPLSLLSPGAIPVRIGRERDARLSAMSPKGRKVRGGGRRARVVERVLRDVEHWD
jgi:hypothetical protein